MRYGQQQSYDYAPAYIRKKNQEPIDEYDAQLEKLKNQSEQISNVSDQASDKTDPVDYSEANQEMAKGAQRGMSGGIGSAVTGAGLSGMLAKGPMGASPYVAAAGFGLMTLEQDAKAKQDDEDAKAVEAQNRKQAQLSAIHDLISVSKGLGV